MKYKYLLLLICAPVFMATECRRNYFFPDPDDNGLSRFTSRGYNVATAYINDKPLVNVASYFPLLQKDSSGNSIDTLKFAWALYPSDLLNHNSIYQNISFQIPVSSTFSKSDLLAFNGQRFLNPTAVVINQGSSNSISGSANLYFVSVTEDISSASQKYIKLSGLFDGNIGDSVHITKGRFDFEVNENNLNF
ncbi:MAG: hypothetical protein M3139_07740 [Bacteroidota bacterium]|nr:hypothetical protein [Bacteroidota bacterium]